MTEKVLEGIREATKTVVTVGTSIDVFNLELYFVEKALPFHGAARLITALSKADKLKMIPTVTGGLVLW